MVRLLLHAAVRNGKAAALQVGLPVPHIRAQRVRRPVAGADCTTTFTRGAGRSSVTLTTLGENTEYSEQVPICTYY